MNGETEKAHGGGKMTKEAVERQMLLNRIANCAPRAAMAKERGKGNATDQDAGKAAGNLR